MNISSTKHTNLHLQLIKPQHRVEIRQFRVYKRRRLKQLFLFNQLTPPLPSPFENLSVNSLDLLAPALGFASGVALYLSRFKFKSSTDIGEWMLFTSPTPFNRFVFLRCPLVSLGDVNEKLVREERHVVRLSSGRMRAERRDLRESDLEEKLEYQRVCVSTEDGGVVSLDWPANLDLKEEHGLDTTLLLVPGTAEGSMDKNVRLFVCEALKHGFFPVVMNPRGCAGSPLTTAR